MANEAEQAIYQRLASAPTFHPASADLFVSDWGLDAGDIVTVKAGENMFNVPIYNMSLNWKGASRTQIQSTGNQERQPLSALKRRQYGGGSASHQEIEELGDGVHADLVRANDKIGLVVTETQGGNVVNAASIVAGINSQDKTSTSYVDIQADYINLTGYIKASYIDAEKAVVDALITNTGYSGSMRVAGALSSNTFQASTITGSTVSASTYQIAGDPGTTLGLKLITLPKSGGYHSLSVLGYGDSISMPNCITSASVSQDGQTLTLTPLVGEPVNFNKASPENGTITSITQRGAEYSETASGGYYTVTIRASGTNLTNPGNYYETSNIIVMANQAYQKGYETGVSSTTAYQEGYADGVGEFTQATVTPQGAAETVYVSDSSGTNYYKPSSTSYNRLGTSVAYKFYGSLYAPEGSGPSWVVQGTGTWYLWTGDHRTAYLYHVGSSVTPVDSNSKITIKSETRYQEGTPDSTTYYTRSSS